MVKIEHSVVENEIIKTVKGLSSLLMIDENIDADSCPGSIGFSSQVLITIMGRLEDTLNVFIPDNIYIFHDKVTHKQLTIKEAADKLIKLAKKSGKH